MATPVSEQGSFKVVTASVNVHAGGGHLLGLFVSAASATPTVEVYNATTSATATCIPQFTPIAGTWYPMPISFNPGLTVAIGGTVNATVSWNPSAT